MRLFKRISSGGLEHHEMRLISLVSLAIIVLATGVTLSLYSLAFSQSVPVLTQIATIGFFDLCVLSLLLAVWLIDRQSTIRRLRQQIGEERRKSSRVLGQANADLLEALPNFSLFQDQLLMEYRRAAANKQNVSVLVITTSVQEDLSDPTVSSPVLGNSAKAISRKLREQDSIYILMRGYFGVILPGVDAIAAKQISARLSEGLADASGASNQFSFRVNAISFPGQASSAQDLELAVTRLLPEKAIETGILASG